MLLFGTYLPIVHDWNFSKDNHKLQNYSHFSCEKKLVCIGKDFAKNTVHPIPIVTNEISMQNFGQVLSNCKAKVFPYKALKVFLLIRLLVTLIDN